MNGLCFSFDVRWTLFMANIQLESIRTNHNEPQSYVIQYNHFFESYIPDNIRYSRDVSNAREK